MGVAAQVSLGEVLRELREAAGLSQEELAARAGLSSHAISALERGTRTRPYPHTVRALSDALGASPEDRARLVSSVPARGTTRRVAGDAAVSKGRDLPVPSTDLLGREAELERVRGLVDAHRLVTRAARAAAVRRSRPHLGRVDGPARPGTMTTRLR